MNSKVVIQYLTRRPIVGLIGYVAALAMLGLVIAVSIEGTMLRWQSVDEAVQLLNQLQKSASLVKSNDAEPTSGLSMGSPFLQGETETVAGAALLQRVSEAVTRVGGSVVSSQVELQNDKLERGYLSLAVNCEIDEAAMQPLLYDLESGVPFLFIEQLTARSREGTAGGRRMQLTVSVTGLWRRDN